MTMRRSSLALIGSLAVALPAIAIGACDGDGTNAVPLPLEAGTPTDAAPAETALDAAPALDAALPPIASNGCRGVPVEPGHHYVTPGMCANVVAAGLGAIRQLTFAPNGDLFGVTTVGVIKRFHDADGDGFYDLGEVTTYADTGSNGNNCHIDGANGYLYAGGPNGVKRFPWSPTATSGGAGEDVVTGQPPGGHSKRAVHVWDGFLYVGSGSTSNVSNDGAQADAYDDRRSMIRRFDLSTFTPGTPFAWLSGEIVTQGLRNPNGFTRNAAGKMFAVVNGMDDVLYQGNNVHNDNPGEQVVEIAMGKQYGYPFCFTAQRVPSGDQVIVPGTQLALQGGPHDDAWCLANSSPPATFIQAHSAPLDITFFDTQPKGGLPERFRGGAFVALHGSWDRVPATGYKVIWIPFDADGKATMPSSTTSTTTFPYETVFGGGDARGAVDGPWSWTNVSYSDQPRFVGAVVSSVDGSLYVTTDSGGYIYRIGLPN